MRIEVREPIEIVQRHYAAAKPCIRPTDEGKLSPRAASGINKTPLGEVSDLENFSLRFNFIKLIQLPGTATWTVLASLCPRFRGFKIAVPERPGLALSGPGIVDVALARLIVKENAISVWKFDQALSDSNRANVLVLEFFNVQAHNRGHVGDLLLVHPDIARCTGAAVTTTTALELQTGCVPRLFVLFCHQILAETAVKSPKSKFADCSRACGKPRLDTSSVLFCIFGLLRKIQKSCFFRSRIPIAVNDPQIGSDHYENENPVGPCPAFLFRRCRQCLATIEPFKRILRCLEGRSRFLAGQPLRGNGSRNCLHEIYAFRNSTSCSCKPYVTG